MKSVEYHIKNINASLHPVPGETNPVAVSLQLEMGEANLLENDTILQSELSIEMDLFRQDQDLEQEDPDFGDISIDTIIYMNVENMVFSTNINIEEEVQTWNEKGYRKVNSSLVREIEGEIMPQLLSPLDHLVQDSFRNIVPRLRFTHDPDEYNNDE